MGILIGRVLFSFAFAAAGLVLLRTAGLMYKKQRELRRRGIVTGGEVVGFETKSQMDSATRGPYYAPIVRYFEPGGSPIEVHSTEYRRPNPYVVGQQVSIRYLPDDPLNGDIDGVQSGWSTLVIFAIFIVVSFTIASLPFVLKR